MKIQSAKGPKYLTLVYQIDLGVTRLLWVGKERTIESFQGFFTAIGEEITSKIVFVCSDMWEPYLKVIHEKCSETMVLTGEADWRTPMSDSEQYYQALRMLGVETVLVRVPDEPHGISVRPSHHVAKMMYILSRFDSHGGKSDTAAPSGSN